MAGAAVAGETADASGVVPEGAVADSIVVLEGAGVADEAALACPNIFDIRLLKIPIGPQYASSPLAASGIFKYRARRFERHLK